MHWSEITERRLIMGGLALALVVGVVGWFLHDLAPAAAKGSADSGVVFEVRSGEGFRTIVDALAAAGLVRSPFATATLAVLTGRAFGIQPGLYKLNAAMSTPEILSTITSPRTREVSVTIPEGANLYQIDAILANALVIRRGDLVAFRDDGDLEGKLFPDTYRFFIGSKVKDVVQKFLENFNAKAVPLLATDQKNEAEDLIVASLVDKEVPNPDDQKIVAGIIWKRLKQNMTLNIDATICYIRFMAAPTSTTNCNGLSQFDYKVNSPYNTYLHQGLPPGPIGNPGMTAITAAISPQSSPYYYYLSDPATGKTIFAKTLDEQNRNRVQYLESN